MINLDCGLGGILYHHGIKPSGTSVRGLHLYSFHLLSKGKKNYAVKFPVFGGHQKPAHPECKEAVSPGKTIFLVMVAPLPGKRVKKFLD